jgi:hypothetical protein
MLQTVLLDSIIWQVAWLQADHEIKQLFKSLTLRANVVPTIFLPDTAGNTLGGHLNL